ncbi:MAG TPA: class I SAM-dependent methyltransferase [Nitrososphaeraceae archaeon]|jgi:SAM-dependent methyltransferase
MGANKLTKKEYWENYWKAHNSMKVEEVNRPSASLTVKAILDIFDKYLPVDENLNAIEIGGSPGRYLVYIAKNFKYNAHSLDYSKIGNEQTMKNFTTAGIPVEIYDRDLFSENFNKGIPLFDIVYSLGFIEHFQDLNLVVKKHTELLKSGGILILGVPNLRAGIYRYLLRRMAPEVLDLHNLNSMKIKNWKNLEKEFSLIPLFTGYIGGFDPMVINKIKKNNLINLFLDFIVRKLIVIFYSKFNFLTKVNSRHWSGYLIGIYKKK